jgi:glycosyltransferase involved in cell wall biosynthesis
VRVSLLTETDQRGTYATSLLMYEKLKSRGVEVEFYTTFQSPYRVLPPPPKSRILGEESTMNTATYSNRILDLISPERGSVLHLMNAWHGIIPLAERRGIRTVINVQYWWPTCYFNSMDRPDCDCMNFLKVSRCIAQRKGKLRGITSPAETLYALRKLRKIRSNLSEASAVIAVSRVVKEVLVERGVPEEKIRVMNVNALNFDIPYAPYEPGNGFTFAYLSYPDREKGVFQLLEAFSLALKRNPGLNLKVLGGLESPQVVETVERLGIKDRVKMTRRVPYVEYVKRLGEFLRDVDVVVVPSLYLDTWGRVVTESMLAGRAVVVTKGNGGLVEQVSDGVDGFHVNVYDLRDFSDSLYRISLMSQEEVRKMGETARRNALIRFDNERLMNQLVELYRSISGS